MTIAGMAKKRAAKPMTNEILQSALTEARYAKAGRNRDESLKLADRLEMSGLRSVAACALTLGLRRCRREHRCFSQACPQCAKAEQALLASATGKFTSDQADETNIVFATIIPPNSSVPMGSLQEFDLANFKRRVRDGLAKTSAIWAAGAVDLTLNEHRDDVFEAHWSPHAHLITATDDINDLVHGLRASFPRSDKAPRPVVVKEWDGDFRAFSYVFKPHFARRISIARATRFNPRTNGTRSCRATTYDRLRVSERIELALFLDAIGLGGRLLFRNVRLYGTAKSVRLQLTTG
jgi:hypothetical protein